MPTRRLVPQAEVVQITAIGTENKRDPVYVSWCTDGGEFRLLDAVEVGSPEPVWVLAVAYVPLPKFQAMSKKWRKRGWGKHGSWFASAVRSEVSKLERMQTA